MGLLSRIGSAWRQIRVQSICQISTIPEKSSKNELFDAKRQSYRQMAWAGIRQEKFSDQLIPKVEFSVQSVTAR